MKIIIFFILIVLVIAAAIYYRSTVKPPLQEAGIRAVFNCDNKKTVIADFVNNKVRLKLSDARNMELASTISGSGARYANPDESFVFWNKGDTAFIEENGQTTFADCLTSAQN